MSSSLLDVLRLLPTAIVLVSPAHAVDIQTSGLPYAQLHIVPDTAALRSRLTELEHANQLRHVLLDPEVSSLWRSCPGLPYPAISFRAP